LGEGSRQNRPPDSRPGEGAENRRRAGFPSFRRRRQLAGPTFNPDTGLFYVHATTSYSVYYLTDLDEQPEGYGGRDTSVWSRNLLQAIDYHTGKVRWSHVYPGLGGTRSGLLSTAGKLLFGGDPTGNLIAFDPTSGRALWHVGLAAPVSNAPITFELDGRQYLVVGAGDMLYSFVLPR